MRRNVESVPKGSPVDAHERTRDYLSEEEFAVLLQGTPRSRYRWRNAAMLMLTFYHGLRVTELCRLKRQDVDLTHGRIWIKRLKVRIPRMSATQSMGRLPLSPREACHLIHTIPATQST